MADPFIGHELGGYLITRLLKRTGMSMIYLARDPKLQREVVVKIMLPTYSGDESFATRFQQEALATARLAHPNIVHIYDFGQREDLSYMVMEYLPGGSLHDRLTAAAREGKRLDPVQCAAIVRQMALALDHAHQAGIIHRDVKPGNVLFAGDGRPVLTDLGIAKAREGPQLTKTMTAIGTPEYMSPEQGRGDPVDGRSDIYSLGVVLYELLAGILPFQADTAWGLVFKHMSEPPPPIQTINPAVSLAMRSVIERAMAKQPEERFQSAREMAEAIQRALDAPSRRLYSTPVSLTRPAGPGTPIPKPTPPRRTPSPASAGEQQTRLVNNAARPDVADERPKPKPNGRKGAWLWLVGGGVVLISLALLFIIGGVLRSSEPTATPTAPAQIAAAATRPPSATAPEPTATLRSPGGLVATASRTPTRVVLPTATPTQPTAVAVAPTATPSPVQPPTASVTLTQPPVQPTATSTTAPRPTATRTATPRPSPLPTRQAAPVVTGPADGARYSNGPNDVILLTWQSQPLRPGEKYVVVTRYTHNTETWVDDQWLEAASLQVPTYLLDNATADRFEWQVQVAREDPAGVEFGGSRRRGMLVGAPSAVRTFYWTGGGSAPPDNGDNDGPTPAPTFTPPPP